jgi:hypothetical protein
MSLDLKFDFKSSDVILAIILVVIGVLSRLVPHGWNFTAIGAIALVSGLLVANRKLAVLTPVLALFISDIFIGFHDTMIYVYGAYALIAGVAIVFSSQRSFGKIILYSVASSLMFFVISNFGVWASGLLYPNNLSGLMDCYIMGVPFYRNQFLSDLILTPVLFYLSVHLLNFQFLSVRKST